MTKAIKVTVVGAAGGIGQPLSLLLKANPSINRLALYDIVHAVGVAADLSHINTPSDVEGFVGAENLGTALKDAAIVVIPAGMPRKPGMTRDDLFKANAGIIANIATAIAKNCPEAHICVITNPVNATVPIVAETLKQHGVYQPNRLYGVTTLDSVRASRFLYDAAQVDPTASRVPIVGGHSGPTIVPLTSQVAEAKQLSREDIAKYVHRVQYGGDEVVQAKQGAGSATLSMAYAGARFVNNLIRAMEGEKNIVEPAYVPCTIVPGLSYFASNVTLSANGFTSVAPIGKVSDDEQALLDACIPELKKNIANGEEYVQNASKL